MATSSFKYLSPACQQIHAESFTSPANIHLVIRSCLADPALAATVSNHRCNGVTLTPAGLYADMAYTAGKYIWDQFHGDESNEHQGRMASASPGLCLFDLEVHKPLIVKDGADWASLWLEMEVSVLATANETRSTSLTASFEYPAPSAEPAEVDIASTTLRMTFRSISPDGTPLQECGHCSLRFERTTAWQEAWTHAFLPAVGARVAALRVRADKETPPSRDDGHGAAAHDADAHEESSIVLIHREAAYRRFESFVQYTGAYQNMAEVVFCSDTREAVARLEFQPLPQDAGTIAGSKNSRAGGVSVLAGPYDLDGSCHISGFVANAVEQDAVKNAYISHGVGSVRLMPEFADLAAAQRQGGTGCEGEQEELTAYVQMRPRPDDASVLAGDVFVLAGAINSGRCRIVGVWESVRFKKIPRRVLDVFLPPPKEELEKRKARLRA